MKNIKLLKGIYVLVLVLSVVLISTCSSDSKEEESLIPINGLEEVEENALLFMLEEEKLARDTYTYLSELWSLNQFDNIKKSEQSHMNAVASLLDKNNIDYTILPYGEFNNQELQALYNKFKIDGAINKSKALQIGATIEDLDIVDLQNFMDNISNASIESIFNSLQCGSKNHLRSFVKAIEINGDTYTPQYLTSDSYTSILTGSQEKCN
ncbi:DUF2202 domain-containing protein [Seonamhaeicola maritimus]|uniref:DUF2202 domain-containing protein n=1 Tax=Seonamhaeicola maritimus TaxID=2591822 RepID=A0A5C7GEL0_9FLAO|nr:DUF2202 domain-containing protein [Seonamhaeicola maritimus]TXG35128.1 DUF2202 domain-containing protein [Seonamhaeicola maritimus]